MSSGEFYVYLDGYHERNENAKENTRLIMWSAIAPHSKKKIKPKDLIPLSRDKTVTTQLKDQVSKQDYLIKKEQIERWHKRNKTS